MSGCEGHSNDDGAVLIDIKKEAVQPIENSMDFELLWFYGTPTIVGHLCQIHFYI